ncbi:MAG: alpha/beta fold hydrolase [Candidatus Aenigmatarchaeota archaeon]
MEEKLYFKNKDSLKLCGILTKPKRKTNKCIVLCHGITVDKEEDGIFTELAKRLTNVGFAVFRFDFMGHGESEGNSIDMTVTGEKQDLESAIKFLQKLGYKNFGILGASFAGGAVSLFVPSHQNIVKALVLCYALIDYHSLLEPKLPWPRKYFLKAAMKKLEKQGFVEIGSSGFKIGRNLVAEMRKLHPYNELLKLKIPILFVHGNKDIFVPYADSVKYSRLLKTAKLEIISGAQHGFYNSKKHEEHADRVVIEFFLKNLAHVLK